MKILYICALDCTNKGGLYNSTIERIKLVNEQVDVKVFSLVINDRFTRSILKKILNKNLNEINIKKYEYKKIKIENIIYQAKIRDFIYHKLNKLKEIDIYVKKISEYIEKNNVDIIHAHCGYPAGYVAKIIKEKYNIPYIITGHGSDIHTIDHKKYIKEKTIEALNNASLLFYVSESLKREAIKLGCKNNNIKITYNGIDTEMFRKTKETTKRDVLTVGYVGNLFEMKGIEHIPKIAELLKREIDFKLNIVGDGPLRKKIILQLDRLGINYQWHGRVNPENIPNIMEQNDFLLVPSKKEGWGAVIIEANALGVYVVGAKIGGIPEAVGKYGSLVEHGVEFEKKVVEEIIKVHRNGYDKEQLIKYASKFSWDEIVRAEMEEYYKIIRGRDE